MQFSLKYPQKCVGLIMISAISKKYPEKEATPCEEIEDFLLENNFSLNIISLVSQQFPEILAEQFILDQKQRELFLKDEEKMRFFLDSFKSLTIFKLRKAGFDNDMQEFKSLPDFLLCNILSPTLILHGAADAEVPESHAQNVAANIANGTLKMYPNGEHKLFITHKEEITSEVQKFLNQLDY